MKLWTRIILIAWLLSGLLAAQAVAFSMKCHAGMDAPDMARTAHAAMAMHDHAGDKSPEHKQATDTCGLSCLAHCLGAAGIVLSLQPFPAYVAGTSVLSISRTALFEGQALGPPLEPPIPRIV